MRHPNYEPFEEGDTLHDVHHVTVRQYPGVAFHACGWEVQADEDTEWTGIEERTGRVICVMVGDDFRHSVDEVDVSPLPRSSFCGECGQIGCHCDWYDGEGEER